MATKLITNGTVLTMDEERTVLDDGAVFVDGDEIVAVGPTDDLASKYSADERIDASGHAVLPGFINVHTHVPDILIRSIATDRRLYDWLYNVDKPAIYAMDVEEHELAAALYCQEAMQSGITTVVENTATIYDDEILDAKFGVTETAGLRNYCALGFRTRSSEHKTEVAASLKHKEPSGDVVTPGEDAAVEDKFGKVESVMEAYHGTADGRQEIWIAPSSDRGFEPEGLARAADLAERHDVMATTHTAESEHQETYRLTGVEYMNNAGYLGDRTLLNHCVHLTDRDVRILARTDTRVSHNPLSNMALGSGISPVPEMLSAGVTVALGTDNPCANDSVNMVNDVQFAAMLHKGATRDPAVITAERALELATIDAAEAIRKGDELGSLEPGKRADVVLVDLEYPHLVPHLNVPAALVYQAQGFEVDTVLCDGEVVVDGRNAVGIKAAYPDLVERAMAASERIVERAGLQSVADRPWTPESRL